MKKHIIFDFDDTISSSYELNQQLYYETFLPYSNKLDEDYIRNYHKASRGKSMIEQFDHVRLKFGLQVDTFQLVHENEELHKTKATDMTIFDGVEDLLKYFKQTGRTLSICTNRNRGSLELILQKYGLLGFFDNIISCADEGHEKPDPHCLHALIDNYSTLSKHEVIYFGDSKTDADFAKNAGIDFLVIDHYINSKKYYALILSIFSNLQDEAPVKTYEFDASLSQPVN